MKTVELTVRFNVTVPDDTVTDDLFLDLDVNKVSVRANVNEAIVGSKIREYETIHVEEI